MKTAYQEHEVPEECLEKWQKTVDLVARLVEVPAALIMRVGPEQIEVLVSSQSEGNPYNRGEKGDLGTGLYCETVMADRSQLQVPNALQDEDWKENPDVEIGMISYLGIPLIWPDGEIFGTICVLDKETRNFSEIHQSLLYELKGVIEGDFRIIQQNKELEQATSRHEQAEAALRQANNELELRVQECTSQLSNSNTQLQQEIDERGRAEEALTTGLRAVVEVADELMKSEDLDVLYRRAVELARERLGMERCAIFIDDGDMVRGTYGTDLQGNTTNEYANVLPKKANWMEWFQVAGDQEPWWTGGEQTLYNWDGEKSEPIGEGWCARTPIAQAGNRPIALFFNDAAISGAPFDPVKQEVVAIFCSLLAAMIERNKAEKRIRQQFEELQRWHGVTLGREERIRELKHDVNALSARLGDAAPYESTGDEGSGTSSSGEETG